MIGAIIREADRPVIAHGGGASTIQMTTPACGATAMLNGFTDIPPGGAVPIGRAVDSNGRATTDPAAGIAGAILPMAGHKGYAIGVVMDMLSGCYRARPSCPRSRGPKCRRGEAAPATSPSCSTSARCGWWPSSSGTWSG